MTPAPTSTCDSSCLVREAAHPRGEGQPGILGSGEDVPDFHPKKQEILVLASPDTSSGDTLWSRKALLQIHL